MSIKIKRINPDDPEYDKALEATKPKNRIDYKALAKNILEGTKGDILKIESPHQNYSNIKVNLSRRGVIFDGHYSLTFDGSNEQEVIYITILG